MTNDVWFEDDLLPTMGTVEKVLKGKKEVTTEQVQAEARGLVRADRPRWRRLEIDSQHLTSGAPAAFYQVRLGFQFDVPQAAQESGARFVDARCAAFLWSAGRGENQPTVFDLYPRDMYEGEPRKVSVRFAPELKVMSVSGTVGHIAADVRVGQVEPIVVGWPGEDERAPYWDLRPKSKKLVGVRHLWLVIEVPQGCSGARLAAMVRGTVQTGFGPIRVGPSERVWDNRPSVVIR